MTAKKVATVVGIYLAVAVVAILILLHVARTPPPPIPFTILHQHRLPDGGAKIDVLVDLGASRADVLALANHFRKQDYPSLFVRIYDDRDAWLNADNDGYPQDRYWLHHLVNINVNTHTGIDKVTWEANERDH